MEQLIQIKDKVSLRQVSMSLATVAIQCLHNLNGTVSYDINNHLAVARAIEQYIQGSAELPEYIDSLQATKELFTSEVAKVFERKDPPAPNFEVKSEKL